MKRLSVLLTAILLLSCLSGCLATQSDLPATPPSQTATSAITTVTTDTSASKSKTDTPTSQNQPTGSKVSTKPTATTTTAGDTEIPAYSGKAYVAIGNNKPAFSAGEITAKSYESYAPLDSLGRCGVAIACIGRDLMPTEDRGSIGQIKPSGWHTVKYDNVDGKYLYNRCHLIGFQLSGENANERNLITGTRYLNVEGMLPFENLIADYVKETGNHVLYRVTPVFEGEDLVATGVRLEGYSVEDAGEGVCFHVFCYNAQPGIVIDYADGSSRLDGSVVKTTATTAKKTTHTTGKPADGDPDGDDTDGRTVYRTPSGKRWHLDPDCGGINSYKVSYSEAVDAGLTACKKCAQ